MALSSSVGEARAEAQSANVVARVPNFILMTVPRDDARNQQTSACRLCLSYTIGNTVDDLHAVQNLKKSSTQTTAEQRAIFPHLKSRAQGLTRSQYGQHTFSCSW